MAYTTFNAEQSLAELGVARSMLLAEGAPVGDQDWVYEPPYPPWKDPAAG